MDIELTRAETILAITELSFNTPISAVCAVVDNKEYDQENYSKELDDQHPEWSLDCLGFNGPWTWQDEDWEGRKIPEPEDHKQWRLNHNKQFKMTKLIVCVTPKKVSKGLYKISEEYASNIADKFGAHKVYEINTDVYEKN